MPSPIVLEVKFTEGGGQVRAMKNAVMTDAQTAIVTYPVDVWFTGSKTFDAVLDFGKKIERIRLDPSCRFPDRDVTDNTWPRQTSAPPAADTRGGPRCQS